MHAILFRFHKALLCAGLSHKIPLKYIEDYSSNLTNVRRSRDMNIFTSRPIFSSNSKHLKFNDLFNNQKGFLMYFT